MKNRWTFPLLVLLFTSCPQLGKPEGFGPFTSAGVDDDLLLKDDEDDDLDFTGKIMETVAKNREVQKTDGSGKFLISFFIYLLMSIVLDHIRDSIK